MKSHPKEMKRCNILLIWNEILKIPREFIPKDFCFECGLLIMLENDGLFHEVYYASEKMGGPEHRASYVFVTQSRVD